MALMQVALRARTQNFQPKSTLIGYLLTVSKNIWRREKKSNKLRVTNDDPSNLPQRVEDIIHSAIEQEKWDLFQEKLSKISENCQQILRYHFRKMSHADIAKEMGYSNDNVVRQRIFKCKKKLKEEIQSDRRYKEIKGE